MDSARRKQLQSKGSQAFSFNLSSIDEHQGCESEEDLNLIKTAVESVKGLKNLCQVTKRRVRTNIGKVGKVVQPDEGSEAGSGRGAAC